MSILEFFSPIFLGRTLRRVFWMAMLAGVYAALPIVLDYAHRPGVYEMPSQFHGALSLVLGWLLVFRTNTAYSRWWEARTVWGSLVNACRNAAVKFHRLGELSPEEQQQAERLLIAFPLALKHHLRGEVESVLPAQVRNLVGDAQHVPLALASHLFQVAARAKQAGKIDGDELRILDSELHRLMEICGACERILKTRIVKSYRVFARQCVMIFLASLPWGIVHDFRLWTVPLTMITAYFMLGLETVAENVEEPFGYDDDDLDLESLCLTIEATVREAFAMRPN